MKFYLSLVFSIILGGLLSAGFSQTATLPASPWPFLDTKTIGAYDFIKAHPTFDGRGVVIIIVDTGVDMGVPGLIKTSEGKVKVIDARDFSGQGDIPLKKATNDSSYGELILRSGKIHLGGFQKLQYQPVDSVYWMGAIDEKKLFQNSEVKDINNNGKENDIFAFLTFPIDDKGEKRWVYYLDEDGDGNIDDDKPRFNYHYDYDTFTFRGRNPKNEQTFVTGVLNIYPDQKMASLHIPDGSHGTHCAGIAAGYQVFGEPTLNGIAPGAQIISAKIGNNLYSGGISTTGAMFNAYNFGVQWSHEHQTPVVFSMSYGIGSEVEGRSDIEKFLNTIMAENEKILVVLSNGNEGPGIGSTGDPSAAFRPISVGALLPYIIARDNYGFSITHDCIFHFSSRGGEVNKPDCLAPGAAASTVPLWEKGEKMWGTSMACPQISGASTLLISVALQERIPYNNALIKRALKYSAIPLPEYTHLDQGTGVANIPEAFKLLKMYAKRGEVDKVLDYEVSTLDAFYQNDSGETAYWRTGDYLPSADTKQVYEIKVLFSDQMNADQKVNFFRAYDLKSDQPWFKLDKSATYIKGENQAKIGGYFVPNLIKEPGLYVETIRAYPHTGEGQNIPEFEMINTVVKPYLFDTNNDYTLKIKGKSLKAGGYHRYFVLVPMGASAMNVKIKASPGKWCGIRGYIFNPAGQEVLRMPDMDPKNNKPLTAVVAGDQLVPGIWEIIPFAYFDLTRISTYDIVINFDGIQSIPSVISQLNYKEGQNPGGELRVTNVFRYFSGEAEGQLDGYQISCNCKITGPIYHQDFEINEQISQVQFNLNVDHQTYELFTDMAVNIRDSSDKILKTEAFDYKNLSFIFKPEQSGIYTLEIIAAFTYPEKAKDSWELLLTEKYYFPDPVKIIVQKNNINHFSLYPYILTDLLFFLEEPPQLIPDECNYSGKIFFKNDDEQIVAELPVLFKK